MDHIIPPIRSGSEPWGVEREREGGGGALSPTCGLKTKESHHAGGLPIICVKHHSQLPPAQRSINSNPWLNIYIFIYSDIATSPSTYDLTHIYCCSQASLSNETSSLQTRFSHSNADARRLGMTRNGWNVLPYLFYRCGSRPRLAGQTNSAGVVLDPGSRAHARSKQAGPRGCASTNK